MIFSFRVIINTRSRRPWAGLRDHYFIAPKIISFVYSQEMMNLKNDYWCLRSQGGELRVESKASRLCSQGMMIGSVTMATTLPTKQWVFLTDLLLPKTGVYILAWREASLLGGGCLMPHGKSRNVLPYDVDERGGIDISSFCRTKCASSFIPGTESALGVTSTSWGATWPL